MRIYACIGVPYKMSVGVVMKRLQVFAYFFIYREEIVQFRKRALNGGLVVGYTYIHHIASQSDKGILTVLKASTDLNGLYSSCRQITLSSRNCNTSHKLPTNKLWKRQILGYEYSIK